MTWFPRLLGIGTAALGAVVVCRPETLAGPCELTDSGGKTSPGVAMLCRGIGARDVVSGLAMTLAPAPGPLRMAVVGRVAADLSDALLLDSLRGGASARGMVATLAAGRGVLSALSGLVISSSTTDDELVLPVEKTVPKRQRNDHKPCGVEERPSPLRRWIGGIVDEELRDTGVIE